jgi:hypothetical protein
MRMLGRVVVLVLQPRNVFHATLLMIGACTTGIVLKVWATGGDFANAVIGGIVVGVIVGPLVWFALLKDFAR